LLVVATFLIAQCTHYWQFLLCQGFAIGVRFLPTVSSLFNDGTSIFKIACGGVYGPANAIIAHWFKKKRGRALGFTAIGSSIGGTTIPIAVKNLIPRVG